MAKEKKKSEASVSQADTHDAGRFRTAIGAVEAGAVALFLVVGAALLGVGVIIGVIVGGPVGGLGAGIGADRAEIVQEIGDCREQVRDRLEQLQEQGG